MPGVRPRPGASAQARLPAALRYIVGAFSRLRSVMAIFSYKTSSGSIEVTERGHGQVAIFVEELGETTAIDLPAESAAAMATAILAHLRCTER
jgi:hypothetical protein